MKQCIQLDDQQKLNRENPSDLSSANITPSKITAYTVFRLVVKTLTFKVCVIMALVLYMQFHANS